MAKGLSRKETGIMIEKISAWNKKLEVKRSANGDGVIATAKYIDIKAADLLELATIVGDKTLTLGRSGTNFRIIIT